MADISKIKLGNVDYNIKDASARTSIGQIQSAIVNTLKFKGITTTPITNEGTQVPLDIYGEKATVANIRIGDLVVYGKAEYVWVEKKAEEQNPAKQYWCLLDALNAYGKLASKDSAAGTTSTQPNHKHTVAVPTYVGTATTFNGSCTTAGRVTVSGGAVTIKNHTASLTGEVKKKLVVASATGVGGTAQVVATVSAAAPDVTTGTAVTTRASIASTKTAKAITSATATCDTVVKNASYNSTSETLALTMGAPSVSVNVTGTANCLTNVTLNTQDVSDFVKTVKAPKITTTPATVATKAATSFTYATGAVDTAGTGSAVVTTSNNAATISAHEVTQGTHSALFTGTAVTVSVSGTPKLKKSTADALTTSDAGGHSHTVTVQ